ncbi:MAG: RMD1 family protein [Acidobacteria bacterium]|nr:RMD1 family protein [Acidobacteriota bacterium]MCI0624913.1 RMD1 family protein [Acidobacteriota bacterium]
MSTLFAGKGSFRVRALLIGERIDLRSLEATHRLAVAPLTVHAGEHGCAVLFRYGVVALCDLSPIEEVSFLAQIRTLVGEPFPQAETEEVELSINPPGEECVDHGVIVLHDGSIERLQIVADILAKSVVLAHHEASIAQVFDRIEPLATDLQDKGRGWSRSQDLTRHIGGALLVHHKMVARVEVSEKPDLLWDRPELERLYARLEDEYELRERHLALERKLELIFRTVETLLDLLQTSRSLRVEWYIVILIIVEILLTLYEIFFKG